MRLIESETLLLCPEEFDERSIGHYAILSHRWGKEELRFSDFEVEQNEEAVALLPGKDVNRKAGYNKLYHFAQVAKKRGMPRIWIDTCCIDKSKSAELQQSLNSMYKWYKHASVCVIHLDDFELETKKGTLVSQGSHDSTMAFMLTSPRSRGGRRNLSLLNGSSAVGLSKSS